jgi:hypothetical protein
LPLVSEKQAFFPLQGKNFILAFTAPFSPQTPYSSGIASEGKGSFAFTAPSLSYRFVHLLSGQVKSSDGNAISLPSPAKPDGQGVCGK